VILLLDVNVVLDVLANRKPWVEDSAALLDAIQDGRANGKIAAHTVTTLHYLLTKHSGRESATLALTSLLEILEIVAVDSTMIRRALSMGWDDYEDAVQGVCALDASADYLVTRNLNDFASLSIPVVTPDVVLSYLPN
jgi:predicted nucleic acid-binding protein